MNNRRRGYFAVGLHQPKDHHNIATALRACHNYGAEFLATSGKRYSKHGADTTKFWRHHPLLQTKNLEDVIPYDCVPVAVDLVYGAQSLIDYVHPERAFYIFGPEDGTLGEKVLSWCRDTIYVPTNNCMNLSVTVGVVLYDRMSKQYEKPFI